MKNSRLSLTTKTMLATVALTGLMAGSAARVQAATSSNGQSGVTAANGSLGTLVADSDKHSCKGQNSCKGQGGCKTSDNGCKGKNSCKGKGGCKSTA
jgi:hypothetical protein